MKTLEAVSAPAQATHSADDGQTKVRAPDPNIAPGYDIQLDGNGHAATADVLRPGQFTGEDLSFRIVHFDDDIDRHLIARFGPAVKTASADCFEHGPFAQAPEAVGHGCGHELVACGRIHLKAVGRLFARKGD